MERDQSWQKLAKEELKLSQVENLSTLSDEGIKVKPLYTSKDTNNIEQQESIPGAPPFTRGAKATMYFNRPWTIRQYAGFSTAEESNLFYKKCLSEGQKGLSVAFDLATHRGYDSDHPRVEGDVGKAGVAIDSIEDMKILFEGIPLDKVSVSMTMNGAVLPVLAAYIVAAEEQGVSQDQLRGTIQNDILKEYMVRNTYIFPPEPSMRIVGDIIEYCSEQMPLFNTVSISGYHMQEAGADSAIELAYTIADGIEYVDLVTKRGIDVDSFAPRLSFFFGVGMNFLMEIAKLRAARFLWHESMQKFNPKNKKSSLLRMHCQTSGYSLTAQEPYNNVVRTTIEALAAILGGTQSLHTNALDEAISLPTEHTARIARNTQLIIKEETDITKIVDPLGGSYAIEALTSELIKKAKTLLLEIEEWGGMTKAIIAGIPKMRIEESATKKQAKIDSKKSVVVGVNKYEVTSYQNKIKTLVIDNKEVMRNQLEGISKVKKNRNKSELDKTLSELYEAAKDSKKNILKYTIKAIRERATVGECTETIEKVFSRHKGGTQGVSMIYSTQMSEEQNFKEAKLKVENFMTSSGRRPRILVAKLGQDGHDRGAKVIASGLADLGFDVDIGPLFQTPEEVVKQAIENDVHFIGVSSQAGAHKVLIPKLISLLKEQSSDNIKIIAGGIIPEDDQTELKLKGVSEIFGPGSSIVDCAIKILDILTSELK